MPLLTNNVINTNVALINATDEIITQAMTARDKNGNAFLTKIVRPQARTEAIAVANIPFGLLFVTDCAPTFGGWTKDGIVVSSEVFEIIIQIIFGVLPTADYHAIGEGIRVAVMKVLQPNLADNPYGFVRSDSAAWRFSQDTMFRAKISRAVRRYDGGSEQLKDSLFSVPIQFKIDITQPGPYYQ